jgi:hypothetical protein
LCSVSSGELELGSVSDGELKRGRVQVAAALELVGTPQCQTR